MESAETSKKVKYGLGLLGVVIVGVIAWKTFSGDDELRAPGQQSQPSGSDTNTSRNTVDPKRNDEPPQLHQPQPEPEPYEPNPHQPQEDEETQEDEKTQEDEESDELPLPTAPTTVDQMKQVFLQLAKKPELELKSDAKYPMALFSEALYANQQDPVAMKGASELGKKIVRSLPYAFQSDDKLLKNLWALQASLAKVLQSLKETGAINGAVSLFKQPQAQVQGKEKAGYSAPKKPPKELYDCYFLDIKVIDDMNPFDAKIVSLVAALKDYSENLENCSGCLFYDYQSFEGMKDLANTLVDNREKNSKFLRFAESNQKYPNHIQDYEAFVKSLIEELGDRVPPDSIVPKNDSEKKYFTTFKKEFFEVIGAGNLSDEERDKVHEAFLYSSVLKT